jgi:hypothetical protein
VIRDNDLLNTFIHEEGVCNYLTNALGNPVQASITNVDENIVGILELP